MSKQALYFLIGFLLVVLVAVFVFYPRPVPEPEVVPAPVIEQPVVAPATSKERGDTAREIIDRLRTQEDEADYAEAYQRAREFVEEGRLADAQLLYFFAARAGYAPAALELAGMYDPGHHSPERSLMDEPDPFQAYKWYRTALESGNKEAAARLDTLRAWAEEEAAAGNMDADRLLMTWED